MEDQLGKEIGSDEAQRCTRIRILGVSYRLTWPEIGTRIGIPDLNIDIHKVH